jgi:rare lipoprotein A
VRAGWVAVVAYMLWSAQSIAAELPADSLTARQEAQRLAHLPPIALSDRHIDHSGRTQRGRVSYYARHFTNRKMADGRRFDPNTAVAASKTLPLGTTAKVINLENGRSATVTVEDRGPWARGRVVDVTPAVAEQLDLRKDGVAPAIVRRSWFLSRMAE